MAERAPIRVTLFERNDPQRTPVAACQRHTEAGRGPLICRLARRLVALGVDPETPLDVRRNGWPVFARAYPIWIWARLTVEEGSRSARVRPYRGDVGSLSGRSGVAATDLPEQQSGDPDALTHIGGAR